MKLFLSLLILSTFLVRAHAESGDADEYKNLDIVVQSSSCHGLTAPWIRVFVEASHSVKDLYLTSYSCLLIEDKLAQAQHLRKRSCGTARVVATVETEIATDTVSKIVSAEVRQGGFCR